MVLSEILSTTFLFSIAIIVILVGGLFAYFNHRLSAQNHKISSMLGLVSTMAEEMQYFRSKISSKSSEQCKMSDVDAIHFAPQFLGGKDENLIEVSDGEDDIDSEVDDSDIEEDDEDSEEEDESESDSEDEDSDSESDDDDDDGKIKTISIDLGKEIDLNIGEEIEQEDLDLNINHNTKTINLSEDISSFDITSKTLENIDDVSIDLNVSMQNKLDYKKMSLNKLRDVVIQKGLVVDASKLKKNDILKMLGDE